MMSLYLDYNSSAPIDSRVVDFMLDIYKNTIGNADSRTHDFGENARRVVENARRQVAHILDINSDEVFFTSGSTESNNIIIQGLQDYAEKTGKKHIITSSIEHKSVLECTRVMQRRGFMIDYIKPDASGRIDIGKIQEKLRDDTLLVSVMHVNNETGIIQPIQVIGNLLEDKDVFFHIDATQSFGKLIEELKNTNFDMLSMSAHKISGPQGIGAMILKRKRYSLPPVKPILYGGQQEHGLRPGTIPVALVGGLGKACELAELEADMNMEKCSSIKRKLVALLDASGLDYKFNGDQSCCIPTTMNLCFRGVSSEALMLSSKEYCSISNGSACNSHSYEPSYVLKAMGITDEEINNSIRVSWGHDIEDVFIERSFSGLIDAARKLAW